MELRLDLRTRDSCHHEVQPSKRPFVVLLGDAPGSTEAVEELEQLQLSMGRQFMCLLHGIHHPAQQDLLCHPAAVAFVELHDGDGIGPFAICLARLCQDLVHCLPEMPVCGVHASRSALSQLHKVVNEDICAS